jgi:predicted CopG family antitoxin
MGDSGITTIQVKVETWKELNGRKEPGQSFDDVIQELLD